MDALTKLEVARATVLAARRAFVGPAVGAMERVDCIDRASRLLAAAKELVEEAEADASAAQAEPGAGVASDDEPKANTVERPVGATEKRWHRVQQSIDPVKQGWHEWTKECYPEIGEYHTGPTPPAAASESPRAEEEAGRCAFVFDDGAPCGDDAAHPKHFNHYNHDFVPAKPNTAKET